MMLSHTDSGATTIRKLGGLVHGERGARAYRGLGAVPQVGPRDKAPGPGVRGEVPLKLTKFKHMKHIVCKEFCNNFANLVKCLNVKDRLHKSS